MLFIEIESFEFPGALWVFIPVIFKVVTVIYRERCECCLLWVFRFMFCEFVSKNCFFIGEAGDGDC